jgi:hypothetical protein
MSLLDLFLRLRSSEAVLWMMEGGSSVGERGEEAGEVEPLPAEFLFRRERPRSVVSVILGSVITGSGSRENT